MARKVKALSTRLYPLFFQTIITSCAIEWRWTQGHLKFFCIYTFKTSLLELSRWCCRRTNWKCHSARSSSALPPEWASGHATFTFLEGTMSHTVFLNKESFNGRLVTLKDKFHVPVSICSCSLYNSCHVKNSVFSIKMIRYLT